MNNQELTNEKVSILLAKWEKFRNDNGGHWWEKKYIERFIKEFEEIDIED